MTIYLDILFLNNTLMSLAILWAVGKFLKLNIKWLKLIFAALFTNLYTIFIIYLRVNNFGTSLPIQILLNIIAAITMIYISYDINDIRYFLKTLGILYLITFFAIGSSLSFFYIYGINPFKAGCLISGIIFLWLIGQYGWRLLQNKNTPKEFLVDLTVIINNESISVKGLVDTGNKLYDPLSQLSVIIIELEYFKDFFCNSLKEKLVQNKGGIINQVSLLSEYDWENRIRVLPYNVIGQDNGMIIGVRPDLVFVNYAGDKMKIEKILIGITDKSLDYEGEYNALVNPEILNIRGK